MDCMHNKITHYVDKKVLLGLWGAIIVTVNVQGTFGPPPPPRTFVTLRLCTLQYNLILIIYLKQFSCKFSGYSLFKPLVSITHTGYKLWLVCTKF